MEYRAIVGAVNGKAATRQKILAADGLMGIVLMLAYYAGGYNLFPLSISPELYLLGTDRRAVLTDLELLSKLQDELGIYLDRKFADLQTSSVPVYLCALRKGLRANRNGSLPALNVRYSAATQELMIPARDFAKDRLDGSTNLLPSWIRLS